MNDSTTQNDDAKRNDMPVMPNPASFVGRWTIQGEADACLVTLAVERVELANAHRLDDPERCLARLLGQPAVGWRPASDGIDFAGSDRLSVGFFSFEGDDAVLVRPGVRFVLSRAS